MNESIKLLQKINIHPTLWVVMGIAVVTAHFTQLLMLFCIVFVHEMGHAVTANHFNWRIKAIQILPFGGSVETEEYGNKSMREELLGHFSWSHPASLARWCRLFDVYIFPGFF